MSTLFGLGSAGGPEGWVLLMLALAGLAAGFIDAVVGGGGLVQVPALFAFVPQGSAASLFEIGRAHV